MEYWPIYISIVLIVLLWILSGFTAKKKQFRRFLVVATFLTSTGCSTVIHLPPQPVYSFEHDSIAANILDFYHVCNKISMDYGNMDLYDFSDKKFDLKVSFIESEFIPGGIREVWNFYIADTLGHKLTIEDFYDHPKLEPNIDINQRISGVKNRIKSANQ